MSTIYNGSAFSSEYSLVPVAQLIPVTSVMSVCKEVNKAVGLRVGLGLGLPLLAALGALSLLLRRARRRSRKSRERADGALPGGGGKGVVGGPTRYDKVGSWHEMTGGDSINEMAGTGESRELGVA